MREGEKDEENPLIKTQNELEDLWLAVAFEDLTLQLGGDVG